MGDGGGGDGGTAVMGGGGACGRVGEREYCRISGFIRELWEDLPYIFPFFFEFLLIKGW